MRTLAALISRPVWRDALRRLPSCAGVGVVPVDAGDLDQDLALLGAIAFGREDVDVRLAEDDEEVALAGVLQVVGHVQVGVHARLEHGDAPQLVEIGGMGVVVEGAGDQHGEIRVPGLGGGGIVQR